MDFTVDSIPVKCVMKFIMKSASEIHNEIILLSVKSVQFNEVLSNAVDFMKSCHILWISWNPVAFSKILLDVMDLIKYFEISGFNGTPVAFHKIGLDFMKSYEILMNFMKSCKIMWIYEIQQISVQIWWTSYNADFF